jgi:ribose 5-phosphate isomerase A
MGDFFLYNSPAMTTAPVTPASPQQLDLIGMEAARLILPGQRVGLGSGKASLAFVRALGRRIKDERLNIIGIPTSIETERVARDLAIPLSTLADTTSLDITVDGADEVDPALNLIKGGGGYATREKVVASISKRFVIVVGGEKIVPMLGTRFPVFLEVLEFARPVVTRRLEALGITVKPRARHDGTNYITDNGNPYLEAMFPPGALADAAAVDRQLHTIPGIIETGLFIAHTDEVIIAHADGRIERKRRP